VRRARGTLSPCVQEEAAFRQNGEDLSVARAEGFDVGAHETLARQALQHAATRNVPDFNLQRARVTRASVSALRVRAHGTEHVTEPRHTDSRCGWARQTRP
jgi:hypothetical protein